MGDTECGNLVRWKNGYRVFVQEPYACNILNKRLFNYPKTVDFVAENSEGIFSFEQKDLGFVLAVMKKFNLLDRT